MKVTWCSHFKRSRAAANRRLGRRKMLAKQANTREAWRICTCFACTGRGRRPDAPCFILLFQKQVKCARKGTVLFFSLLRKEPKVAEGPRPSRLPENGSKLYRIIFFVLLPSFVPTPVCGATRFFGCFEPVRKGRCSADARPLLFENGILYCKLTGACRIRKGWLLVIFVAEEIYFCGTLIESFELNQGFAFPEKFRSI